MNIANRYYVVFKNLLDYKFYCIELYHYILNFENFVYEVFVLVKILLNDQGFIYQFVFQRIFISVKPV